MHICCKIKLEKELITIDLMFDKLTTALRTAADNDSILEKEATSYGDIFDAYEHRHSIVMSLNNYRKHTFLMLMQKEVYQIFLEFECYTNGL